METTDPPPGIPRSSWRQRRHSPSPKFSCFELTAGRNVATLTECRPVVCFGGGLCRLIRSVCADSARVACALFSKPNGSRRGGSSCRWLSPCDYGRHRSASRPLLRQQHALAGLAGQYDIGVVEREKGAEIAKARQDGAAPRCSPSCSCRRAELDDAPWTPIHLQCRDLAFTDRSTGVGAAAVQPVIEGVVTKIWVSR
jgi:hypothetical protein